MIADSVFQSTPSRRGRHIDCRVAQQLQDVSIHSLTQRETVIFASRSRRRVCFNPLPHAEGDLRGHVTNSDTRSFQSTPSRRGRQVYGKALNAFKVFQSTPSRRGRRVRKSFLFLILQVSIHSLTQRETGNFCVLFSVTVVSIHSLTQRETWDTKRDR